MWTLSRIHQLGELLAAVAIVMSLLFVGYEIQRSSQAQIQATTQNVISEYNSTIQTISDSSEMACIYARGIRDFLSLAGADQVRLSAFLITWNRVVEDIFYLEARGAVDPNIWLAIESQQREVAQLQGFQQWFALRKHWMSPEYQAYTSELIENPVGIEPLEYDDPECETR